MVFFFDENFVIDINMYIVILNRRMGACLYDYFSLVTNWDL